MLRIDTHHHLIPPDYRNALRKAGIDEAGGRALPDCSPEGSLQTMADLDVGTAIVSVSTPGTTFLPNPGDAAALARDLNDYTSVLVATQPERFGFFATIPMPHIDESVAESVGALDDLKADGVVLLANSAGTYLGEDGRDELFAALDGRSAVVFIHPAPIYPGRPCPVSRRSRSTSCSTPRAQRTYWCATAFVAGTRISSSS
jgi:6-methylsalicylate decarboxylase